MRVRSIILVALAVGLLPAAALADTEAGVAAWKRGDYAKAVAEWRTAAKAGDPDAAFNLGQAYKLGRGVPVDTKQAENWYQQAAATGHVEAENNYGLALFQNGRAREAIPYLEKAVTRGEPRAQYILGTMLFNGVDIKKDWPRAYALTSRAAQAGLSPATQSLQQMDQYLSVPDKQQGIALAARMASAPAPVGELAGRGGGAVRGVELPPSEAGLPGVTPAERVPLPGARPPARPVAEAPRPRPSAPAAGGRWRLQLGAFGDAGNARRLGAQLGGRFPGRSIDFDKAGALTRVTVGPYASRAEAQAACGAVKPCVPVSN